MIRKQDLGAMTFIAEGGVGRVYRIPAFRLLGSPELAYKELKPIDKQFTASARKQAREAMQRSVAFRAGLGPADRDDLDQYTTWPIAMVEDNGEPCGCVMPLIPQDFFLTTRPSAGPSKELVFELGWLSAKDSQAQVMGVDRSGIKDLLVRIALLTQLVYAVGRLHMHGAVYGDLSLKNAALAVGPPRVKLLDCDAVAAIADQDRVQLHSNFFTPPECAADKKRLQDDRTDVYKLGLCIIRGLQQGPGVTQTKDPAGLDGKLDPPAIALIARAVGSDPAARPTAKELFGCLVRNLNAKVAPPELHSASLGRRALLRGTDVEVVWAATGGREIRIEGSNGLVVTLPDTGVTPARHHVTPLASGEITVEVSNDHGSVRAVAGEVQLYELPSFQLDTRRTLPRPVIGALPAVELPSAHHDFPPTPVVTTAGHPSPTITAPPLAPLIDAVSAIPVTPLDGLADVSASAVAVGRTVRGALDPIIDGSALDTVTVDSARNARALMDQAWDVLRRRVDQELHAVHQRRAAS